MAESHYDREWSPDEPETAATATQDAPVTADGTSGRPAIAEDSASLGKPISLEASMCKCGHSYGEHEVKLFESVCRHVPTQEEWMDPRCKCREFMEAEK